jgi:hypothetical protein
MASRSLSQPNMCKWGHLDSEPSNSPILSLLGMHKNLFRPGSFSEPAQLRHSTARCRFLEIPAELRLMIYDYLLISRDVLVSKAIRGNKPYGLSLTILRVNHLVYLEASSVFYQNNAFHIGSWSQSEPSDIPKHGQIDPPIPRACWPSLRNLSVTHKTASIKLSQGPTSFWARDDTNCEAYVCSLTTLLESCGPHLGSLKLTANVGRLGVNRKSVRSLSICDRGRQFVRALAALTIPKISIHFDFPDAFFYVDVDAKAFLGRSIPLMACQIMFCHAQTKIDRLLASFGGSISISKQTERVDLSPIILKTWKHSCLGIFGATTNLEDEIVNPS